MINALDQLEVLQRIRNSPPLDAGLEYVLEKTAAGPTTVMPSRKESELRTSGPSDAGGSKERVRSTAA
jgi:hypothetical protein